MVNEVQAIVDQFGGPSLFGKRLKTEEELRETIRQGLPRQVLDELIRSCQLTMKELAASLDLSVRSLQRRRGSDRLTRHESDRLYRLARIVVLAKYYIGEEDVAFEWLRSRNRALGGKIPLELLDTEAGARTVENVLGRIAFGGIS